MIKSQLTARFGERERMKILIAIPTFESVAPETFKSLWELDRAGHEVDFECVRGYDCAVARNRIANDTIAGGYDAVLMVDSDVVLPPDALKLLAEDNVPVALGWYRRRSWSGESDGSSVMFHRAGQFLDPFTADELKAFATSDSPLVPVSGGGLGCALIRTEVFEGMRRPHFRFYTYHDTLQTLSEDLYFAVRCQKHDIPIMCDSRVACGHRFVHIQEA